MAMEHVDPGNDVDVGAGVHLTGWVRGHGNQISVADAEHGATIRIAVSGNNNVVHVERAYALKSPDIRIGNHVPAHRAHLQIGANFSIESGGRVLLPNSGSRLVIGRDCMFSQDVTIRCGESPHLIFDRDSGEYLDVGADVSIGNHVWLGEGVYVTKRARIAEESVVAARAVVTRRFDQPHTVLGGNPAAVVREGVTWVRNRGVLEEGGPRRASYDAHRKTYE